VANVRRDEARIWFVRFLMRKVRADTYPSTTDLDLIEAVIPGHMLDEYVEILIDKVDTIVTRASTCCVGSSG
jgi:hypothetical protein